jgi:steroid 5-alpha reductase family enzyme
MKRFVLFIAVCSFVCAAVLALASNAAPFASVLVLTGGFTVTCFVFGAATGDYSWVDRLWSLLPVLFAWIYAASGGFGPRVVVVSILVTIWGARLTRNFARRGGYTGTEDYRWSILRGRMRSPVLWQTFNAVFICAAQLGVIALFSAPMGLLARRSAAATAGGAGARVAFAALSVLSLLFLAYETEADREQWEFQRRKGEYLAERKAKVAPRGDDVEAAMGFRSSGLFRLSRHPAYFGELGFWWSLYLLCAVGSGTFVHWSGAGALALTALFVGSTRFTESLSAAKYPAYAEYRRRTSAVVPWFKKRKSASVERDA